MAEKKLADVRLYTREGPPAEALPQADWKHIGQCGDLYIDDIFAVPGPGQVFVGLKLPRFNYRNYQKAK